MTDPNLCGFDKADVFESPVFRLGKFEIQCELATLISICPGIGRAEIARLTGLTLRADAGSVPAADIGITHVRLVIANFTSQKLTEEIFSPEFSVKLDVILERIVAKFTEMRERLKLSSVPLRAVVVGVASPIDFESGVLVRPPMMPGWDSFPVGNWLSRKMNFTVLVDNDVNLMALGEARSRPVAQSPLLFIKVASGIGCGIITKSGDLHRGADGDAGDIGHIGMKNGANETCACGNLGSIEAIASVNAITRKIRDAKGGESVCSVDLAELVYAGGSSAIWLVREASAQIDEVVATLVNMFNPACIVLGGKLAHMSDDLMSGVRAAVYRRATPLATRRLSIENSLVGRDAGIIGSIAMGVYHTLSPQGLQKLQRAR